MWKNKIRGMPSQKSDSFSALGDLFRTSEVVIVAGGGLTLMAMAGMEAAVAWAAHTRMGVEEVVVVDTKEAVVSTRMAGVVVADTRAGTRIAGVVVVDTRAGTRMAVVLVVHTRAGT